MVKIVKIQFTRVLPFEDLNSPPEACNEEMTPLSGSQPELNHTVPPAAGLLAAAGDGVRACGRSLAPGRPPERRGRRR